MTYGLASNIGLIAFALASVAYLYGQGKPQQSTKLQLIAFIIFLVGAVASLAAVLSTMHGALIGAPSGMLLAVCLSILTVVAHYFFRMPSVGLFFSPLITLILLIDYFTQPSLPLLDPGVAGVAEWLKLTHIGVAILGETFAIGCCVIAILYLMQQRALKEKRIEAMGASTPTLHRLDRLLTWGLWLGLLGITAGLVTGAIYSQYYVPHAARSLELKVLWAIAVWIWYLATLLARQVLNRSAVEVAKMCLAGFLLLSVAFFGMVFFHSPGGI